MIAIRRALTFMSKYVTVRAVSDSSHLASALGQLHALDRPDPARPGVSRIETRSPSPRARAVLSISCA